MALVQVQDIEPSVLKQMLRYFYTGRASELDEDKMTEPLSHFESWNPRRIGWLSQRNWLSQKTKEARHQVLRSRWTERGKINCFENNVNAAHFLVDCQELSTGGNTSDWCTSSRFSLLGLIGTTRKGGVCHSRVVSESWRGFTSAEEMATIAPIDIRRKRCSAI